MREVKSSVEIRFAYSLVTSSFVAYEKLISLVGELDLVGHVEVGLLVCVLGEISLLMLASDWTSKGLKLNLGFPIVFCRK